MRGHRGLFFLLGCAVALACAGCGGNGGGGGPAPPQVVTQNLPPFFQGVAGVVTAGGSRILAAWREATDDHDDTGDIRYRVYVAETSDGFDFTAPVLTTAPGVQTVQLTSGHSPFIGVGKEAFVAVRAVDTDGAEDLNAVECAVTCVDPAAVAYVRTGVPLQGTVGNPLDPFATIQEGIDAIGSAGGVVLVAGGTYREFVVMDASGAPGSTIGVYGAFDPADFVGGVTAERLLGGVDPEDHPTILDGTGRHPDDIEEVGLFNVRNGRRTYVGILQFRDEEGDKVFLGATDVDLVVAGSDFLALHEDEVMYGVVVHDEGSSLALPSLDVVGCAFTGFPDGDGVSVWDARLARLRTGACVVNDCDDFVDAETVVPAGAAFDFRFEGNWIARLSGAPFWLGIDPQTENQAGHGDYRILGNRMSGCQYPCTLEDIGTHGAGGQLDVLVERNFIGPMDDYGLEVVFLPYVSWSNPDKMPIAARDVTLTVRDTVFSNTADESLYLDRIYPGPAARVEVLVEDCDFVLSDYEAIYHWPSLHGDQTAYSQDGATWTTTIRDVRALGVYQFVEWEQPLLRGGTSTFVVDDCVAEGVTDDYGIEISMDDFGSGASSLGEDTARSTLRITDTVLTMGYDYEAIYVYMDVYAPGSVLDVSRNGVIASYETVYLDVDFPIAEGPASLSQNGASSRAGLDLFIEGNVIEVAEEYAAIYVYISGEGKADLFTRIANNRVRTGEYALDFYARAGNLRGVMVLEGNTFLGVQYSDATAIDLRYGEWSVLAARNLVIGSGADGDDGLNFDIDDSVLGADVIVRNNIVAHNGEGIEFDGYVITGQIFNNTVAFCGNEYEDTPIGSDMGGRHSPVCVVNCISWGNMVHDFPENVIPFFTCLGYADGGAGYGCIETDPVFQRHGLPTDANEWFALSPASPAIDAGDPDPDFNDRDGTRNDLGAFGGPGAGPVGFLNDPTDPRPFLIAGLDPLVDLYAGAPFLTPERALTVIFSDPVDATSVTAATLSFTAGGVALPGTYAVDGRRVTFTPEAGWPAGAAVHMVATTDLLSADGAALDFRHGRWFPIEPPDEVLESEDNDTPGSADELGAGGTAIVLGGLAHSGDRDFYRFSGTAGARLQASLFGMRIGSDADFALRLTAADGTTLLFENSYALPEGDPFVDFMLPAAGTYYLEVFHEGGGFETDHPYELQIWRFDR